LPEETRPGDTVKRVTYHLIAGYTKTGFPRGVKARFQHAKD